MSPEPSARSRKSSSTSTGWSCTVTTQRSATRQPTLTSSVTSPFRRGRERDDVEVRTELAEERPVDRRPRAAFGSRRRGSSVSTRCRDRSRLRPNRGRSRGSSSARGGRGGSASRRPRRPGRVRREVQTFRPCIPGREAEKRASGEVHRKRRPRPPAPRQHAGDHERDAPEGEERRRCRSARCDLLLLGAGIQALGVAEHVSVRPRVAAYPDAARGETRSVDQRCVLLAPLAVADGSAEHPLEDRPRRLAFLVRDEADAGDEQVAEQRSVDPRGDERSLERPHAPLGVRLRARAGGSRRRAARRRPRSSPCSCEVSSACRIDLRVSRAESTGTGRTNPCNDPTRRSTCTPTSGRIATRRASAANIANVDITGFEVEAIDGVDRQDRRGHVRDRLELHRRRHRPVDLRQEGHAPGGRRPVRSTRPRRRSSSTGRRTRSRTRPSSTTR